MRFHIAQAHRLARGITLIECVIAVAIVAALMSIALPSFGEAMARARLRAAAQDLALDLGNARLESVRQGAGLVHVSVRPGSAWCWSVGPVADADCHAAPAGTLHVARADDYVGVTMTRGVSTSFDGRDALAAAGFAAEFALPQGQQLRVQVTPLGRATICSPQGTSLDFPRCAG
ncbi:MAG TPA: GspH/FimT family pseudopilin [Burkholderiaceae bacterium]|nr:GspH/FimT family pseudopilin [Burkholderiaceae bacterium]